MKKILSILLTVVLLGSFGAVFASAASDYEVFFHAGDDPLGEVVLTSLPPSMWKDVGDPLTLPTQIPVRPDYKFLGWATSPILETGQKVYKVNVDEYDSDNFVPLNLYAIWEYNVCLVTFNDNTPPGGTVTGMPSPNPVKKTKGTALALSTVGSPACNGYTFVGWARSATGPLAFSPNGYCSDDTNLTLYAVWEADTYTVTLNANSPGGAVTGLPDPPTLIKTRGVNLQITEAPVLDNVNYIGFSGWATTAAVTV